MVEKEELDERTANRTFDVCSFQIRLHLAGRVQLFR